MATYLCKTEPDDYSYADLERDGSTVWDGVANPAACKHIRAIAPGDVILMYHTGTQKRIAGLGTATSGAYHDPGRDEQHTNAGEIKFPVFDIEPARAAGKDYTLADVKADERFADFALVTQGRLSVMPVPASLAKVLRSKAGL